MYRINSLIWHIYRILDLATRTSNHIRFCFWLYCFDDVSFYCIFSGPKIFDWNRIFVCRFVCVITSSVFFREPKPLFYVLSRLVSRYLFCMGILKISCDGVPLSFRCCRFMYTNFWQCFSVFVFSGALSVSMFGRLSVRWWYM